LAFQHREEEAMHIRPFEASDEEAVVALWQRCGLTRPWNDPRKDIRRKLRVRPDLFLVGVLDGEIIATAMAGYEGHRGWISRLAVLQAHRRKGIGQALLSEAEKRLAALGCIKVNLQVLETNAAVVRFYGEAGYEIEPRISMSKRLKSI
jgi:ribosomal protein S18 acetylase RimI-like enzyme